MAGYIGSKVAVVSSGAERKKVFTATSGQTSFTGLSYTVNNVHVFQNGVRLVDGTDYTATNGNSITLTVGAATDDQVVVVSYSSFQTSDTVSASAGGTFLGDVNFTGAFTSQGIDDNATGTAMTLDASGNVGIGTSSPSYPFHVSGTGDKVMAVTAGALSVAALNLGNSTNLADGGIRYDNSADALILRASNAERMRLDASGNLLVGTTSSSSNTAGIKLTSAGTATFVRSGVQPVYVNRLTSDGDLAVFAKDGSTVGSIGTKDGDMYLGTGDTALRFHDGNNQVYPSDTSTGTSRDALTDLGHSGGRFKDLYLSGGVVFGDASSSGTSSSNTFDSYEEGTWSPKITGNSGAFSQTYSQQSGRYTRIGNFVYMTYDVHLSDAGSPSGTYMVLGNLPFTPLSGNHGGSLNVTYYSGWQSLNTSHIAGYIGGSNAYLTNGSNDYIRVADGNHSATSRLIGSGWFMVA